MCKYPSRITLLCVTALTLSACSGSSDNPSSTAEYTVGGTVTGANSAILVINDTGGNDLAPSSWTRHNGQVKNLSAKMGIAMLLDLLIHRELPLLSYMMTTEGIFLSTGFALAYAFVRKHFVPV